MTEEILNQKFWGNTLENYLWFAGIIIAGLIFRNLISRLVSWILFNLLGKYFKTVGIKKFVELLSRPFSFFILMLIIYLAFDRLEFPLEWHLVPRHQFGLRMSMFKIFESLLIFSFTWILLRLTDYIALVLLYRAEKTETKMDDQLVPFFRTSLKVVICIVVLFIVLGKVFELNVASIIAGLGIGGLAVALASKDTLENPFTLGDLVQVGNVRGHVEEIGFRSTKIRTLDKTYVTVPNKRMMDAELENQTERTFVRCRTIIGVTYSTTREQMKSILSDLRVMLNTHEMIHEGSTVFFTTFNSSSLDIELIYLVKTITLDKFSAVREDINFKIIEIIEKNGSSFAFPTQTIFLQKEN
jgi:MscS family membrane protein